MDRRHDSILRLALLSSIATVLLAQLPAGQATTYVSPTQATSCVGANCFDPYSPFIVYQSANLEAGNAAPNFYQILYPGSLTSCPPTPPSGISCSTTVSDLSTIPSTGVCLVSNTVNGGSTLYNSTQVTLYSSASATATDCAYFYTNGNLWNVVNAPVPLYAVVLPPPTVPSTECNTYNTNWLPINGIVLLLTFAAISVLYLFSRFLPANTKAKLTGIVKIELTTALISVFILMILFSFTSVACSTTSYLGQQLQINNPFVQQQQTGQVPFPALDLNGFLIKLPSPVNYDPFTYSEDYVGGLTFNLGLTLATEIYGYSYEFSIYSGIWDAIGSLLSGIITSAQQALQVASSVQLTYNVGLQLGAPFGILSDLFIDLFAPIIMIGVGAMFMQYSVLFILQAVGFTILLPVALIMRSFAFTGGNLRNASNAVLAIAIAAYIIYPLTIVFDSYAMSWTFTPCPANIITANCNPSASFLEGVYTTPAASRFSQQYSSPWSSVSIGGINIPLPSLGSIMTSLSTSGIGFGQYISQATGSGTIILDVQTVVLQMSEFIFTVIMLFAINLSITFGFAMGLTRALNNGIEGAASFWTSV